LALFLVGFATVSMARPVVSHELISGFMQTEMFANLLNQEKENQYNFVDVRVVSGEDRRDKVLACREAIHHSKSGSVLTVTFGNEEADNWRVRYFATTSSVEQIIPCGN